jgi:ABC-type polysaccharide/polyol phosphate export permease
VSHASTPRFHEGWADVRASLRKHEVATTLGWHDVAQRYRRSRVGAFWLTINMGVLIATIGTVFGTLFRTPLDEFLPYVTVGLILWGFLQTTINEGCNGFIASEGIILQVRMPLFVHLMRILWRNAIILGHNLLIFPVVLLVLWRPVGITALLAVPGFALLLLNAAWMVLVLAVVCARFRDMVQVMQNVMQVLFYLTPLIWSADALPDRVGAAFIQLNPFFHLISIVRAPLLGSLPAAHSWWLMAAMAVVGWALALLFYGRYRRRVPYWL